MTYGCFNRKDFTGASPGTSLGQYSRGKFESNDVGCAGCRWHAAPQAQSESEAVSLAIATLDTMATIWAAGFDVRKAVRAISRAPDAEDRMIKFLKAVYGEGLYEGRTSHILSPGRTPAAPDLLIFSAQASQ
jgi:hypothetical protein